MFTLALKTREEKRIYYCWNISVLRRTLPLPFRAFWKKLGSFLRGLLERSEAFIPFILFLTHLQLENFIILELLSSWGKDYLFLNLFLRTPFLISFHVKKCILSEADFFFFFLFLACVC